MINSLLEITGDFLKCFQDSPTPLEVVGEVLKNVSMINWLLETIGGGSKEFFHD